MPAKGKVKWFSNVKGYGFIQSEASPKDIFVHYKSIEGEGYKTLKDKEDVEFELSEGQKGPHAIKVTRIHKNKVPKTEPAAPEAEKKATEVKAE